MKRYISGKIGSCGARRTSITGQLWAALLVIAVIALTAMVPRPVRAQNDETRVLEMFYPARGSLNDDTPAHEWTFTGQADQVIAVLAVTTSGDLDPVIEIFGPGDDLVAQNDDLASLVTDAGLEALRLPADGLYTVRVSRYQGEQGTTRGEYELTLTPGYAQIARASTFEQGAVSWLTQSGEPVPLTQGRLQMRVTEPGQTMFALPPEAEPLHNLYLEASAKLYGSPSYAEVGIVFRLQRGASGQRAYQFKINTSGQWNVIYQDESSVYSLRPWLAHPALADGTAWTLAVLARENEFAFYANGVLLGTLTDDRLSAPGEYGVLVASHRSQEDAATLHVDNVLVTTRLGTTYTGLPLALTNWDSSDPGDVVGELAAGGHIVPVDEHDLFVPEASLTLAEQDARFELIGTEQAVYDDFVLSAHITLLTTEGANVGCGLAYRWIDQRNLDLAFVDSGGGFGVVQAHDGDLLRNAYDLDPMVQPDTNKLIVIAQNNQVVLYVNGALVTQEHVAPGTGRVAVAVLNYEPVRTDCYWSDIWVWPLEN